jgi:hypothetical protein
MMYTPVVLAHAGTHTELVDLLSMGSRLRGNDGIF